MLKFFPELPVRFVKTLEEEVTVVKGQPLYLSCELNKERDVVWRKDGKIVVEKPGKIVPGVIGLMKALTINDADDFDAGTYTVTVESANNLECSSCVKVVGEYFAGKFYSMDYYTKKMEKRILVSRIRKSAVLYLI